MFILRVAGGLALLSFVAVLFVTIRRDSRLAAAQVEAQRRGHGRLCVVKSTTPRDSDATYPLLPVTTIGRAPTNTIQVVDSFASNHHAMLALRAGQWWLEDRKSRNGTLLNGERLHGPAVVSTGDVIGIGELELRLDLD